MDGLSMPNPTIKYQWYFISCVIRIRRSKVHESKLPQQHALWSNMWYRLSGRHLKVVGSSPSKADFSNRKVTTTQFLLTHFRNQMNAKHELPQRERKSKRIPKRT